MSFYSYIHARPDAVDANGIFYVGKGQKSRAFDWYNRNRWHNHVLQKYGTENILVGKIFCSSEEIAFELESGLIKCLKRMKVNLTNQTEGGDGSSGYKKTEEQRLSNVIAAKLHNSKPEIKEAKRLATSKINKQRWNDPEYRAKACLAMKGKKKTLSQSAIDARRANLKKALASRLAKKANINPN